MSDSGGLSVGDMAPKFSAPLVTSDGAVEDTPLSSLLADSPVLLSFYTNDFGPDCIDEWCLFRDYDWFASGDHVQVVGISKSRPKTHRRFINHLDLQFPLYTGHESGNRRFIRRQISNVQSRQSSETVVFPHRPIPTIRYIWVGDHPIDPTMDTPPLSEIHDAIEDAFGSEPETFGF
ncbi:redoxin domain-containing protein [Haladaptatus sp. DFWS20]|uniref:redoxin domain-containing protein n=1 Tax=Haladaptatus sp. DFWS20 TaxID=3403467 RepID=UPI003EBC0A9B